AAVRVVGPSLLNKAFLRLCPSHPFVSVYPPLMPASRYALSTPQRTESFCAKNPTGAILNHMVQYSTSKNARIDPFDAVSDPTRRGILERLGRRDASISEL